MNPTLATSASRWGFLPLLDIRTHPRFKSESVGRFTTHEPHPRYKCESVGFSSITRHTDPPSLQERVGGPFLRLMSPTLATSASRWGFLPLLDIRTHPRYKSESVGRFHTPAPHPRSKRESVGFFLYIILTRTHPRCKRESVGRFHARTHPVPHPRSKRESVGSYIVLLVQKRPKRRAFGPL
jgi:hypothetical protein